MRKVHPWEKFAPGNVSLDVHQLRMYLIRFAIPGEKKVCFSDEEGRRRMRKSSSLPTTSLLIFHTAQK